MSDLWLCISSLGIPFAGKPQSPGKRKLVCCASCLAAVWVLAQLPAELPRDQGSSFLSWLPLLGEERLGWEEWGCLLLWSDKVHQKE